MRPCVSRVSVQFLVVGETNSMVGYHLIAEGHSIQLWFGERVSPQQAQGSILIITILLILMIIFSEILIKWIHITKQCVYQTYDMKYIYLNTAGK